MRGTYVGKEFFKKHKLFIFVTWNIIGNNSVNYSFNT